MKPIATSGEVERALVGRPSLKDQLLAFTEVLLLSVWLGSMLFFNFAVPQSAFAVLPSREMVGLVVTSTITKVEVLGLIVGPLLLLVQSVAWRSKREGAGKAFAALLIAAMSGAAAVSRLWVTPKMASLRVEMGGVIDSLSETDPLRVQFNSLHNYSVGLMSVAMFAGLIVLFLTLRSWLRR